MRRLIFVILAVVAIGFAAFYVLKRAKDKERESDDAPISKTDIPDNDTPETSWAWVSLPDDDAQYLVNGMRAEGGSKTRVRPGPVLVYAYRQDAFARAVHSLEAEERWRAGLSYGVFEGPGQSVMERADAQRRGYVDSSVKDAPKLAWSLDLESRIRSTPVILNDRLYVSTDRFQVVAIDNHQGRILWKSGEHGSDISVASLGEFLVTANDRGFLAAFRGKDGKARGEQGLGSFATSLTVLGDARLLSATGDGHLHLLDVEKGLFGRIPFKEKWVVDADLGSSPSIPVIHGDMAVFAPSGGGLVSRSLEDGSQIWSYRAQSGGSTTHARMELQFVDGSQGVVGPAADDGSVYAWVDEELTALAIKDGKPKWSVRLDAAVTSGISCPFGMVVFGDADGRIRVLDAESGEHVFDVEVSQHAILAAPLVVSRKLVALTQEGRVVILDVVDGAQRDLLDDFFGDRFMSPPAAGGGGLFVVTESGRIGAYR